MPDTVRIDKYIWAIRCFKTRSEASDACNGGKVRLNGNPAKASKTVKRGDVIDIRKGPAQLSYKVLELAENRMGAQMVPQYARNLTPQSEMDKFRAPRETVFVSRERGTGRPTKKERREIDALFDALDDAQF